MTFRQQMEAIASANIQDYLCKQLVKNSRITRDAVPDPFGTYGVLLDTQVAIGQAFLQCPNDADSQQIFGEESEFQGGQCPTRYTINGTTVKQFFGPEAFIIQGGWGPFEGFRIRQYTQGSFNCGVVEALYYGRAAGPLDTPQWIEVGGAFGGCGSSEAVSYSVDTITRLDGLPDNCGDPPPISTGQMQEGFDSLEVLTIDESTVNYQVDIDFGGDVGIQTINMPFSNFSIDELFPYTYSFDVGGKRYKVEDDVLTEEDEEDSARKDNPRRLKNLQDAIDKAVTELEEIQECVCSDTPANEIENVVLPVTVCDGNEGDKTATKEFQTLQVLKDSVTASIIEKFDNSAEEAIVGCESTNYVPQQNAMELYTASTTQGNEVIFTPEIPAEVVSVVCEINSYNSLEIRVYKLAGEQSEAKFGFMHIAADQFNSGGDPQYLWTRQTYFRLPPRTKPIRLRISTKPGTNFTIWDTGERGIPRLPYGEAA